jgi:hypothetical protein
MPIVKDAKRDRRGVKDTGWLLRHARNVTSIKVKVLSKGKAYLYAYLNSGEIFISVFDDHNFCLEWLCTRRSLRDVVRFGTTNFVIRQAVRVTDGHGNPYHLIACECDNTHQQNDTVCRWCSANRWSGSPDPCSPDDYWIDDKTNERVSAVTGERTSHVCAFRCRCGADLDYNSKCPIKGCTSARI